MKQAGSTATDPDEPVTISFGADGNMRLGDVGAKGPSAGVIPDSDTKDEL